MGTKRIKTRAKANKPEDFQPMTVAEIQELERSLFPITPENLPNRVTSYLTCLKSEKIRTPLGTVETYARDLDISKKILNPEP